MTEERRIIHLSHEDFPDILLPCYITSTGEVYQWSKRYNKVVQKKPMHDKTHDKAVVNLANDTTAKYETRPIGLASYVYRYFSGKEIGSKLNLGYRDGDCMNCNINNLFQRDVRYNKHPRVKRTTTGRKVQVEYEGEEKPNNTDICGMQNYQKSLVLSDFDSVMLFFEMKRTYPTAAETKLTIDTTDWTAEQLRKLLKMRKRLDDAIIK